MPDHNTRTRILHCTIQLLGESGEKHFSASKLAAAAGISKATLFHHFRSIDHVPIEAFDLWSEEILGFQLPEAKSLYQSLIKLGSQTFKAVDENRRFLRAYFVFVNKAMFDDELRAKMNLSTNQAIEKLASGMRAFLTSKRSANDLARMVLTQLDGISLQLLMGLDDHRIVRLWKQFCQRITD